MPVVLAATHHDPDGRLYDQAARVLPWLVARFGGLAIEATKATRARSLQLLIAAGARVRQETGDTLTGLLHLGRSRRAAVELALEHDAAYVLFCDFDRALHWAERYPDELERVIGRVAELDFTILGRTERAFASHPRIQRDTEAIVNQVYTRISGCQWDVTAAARGLSRAAAEAMVEGGREESIGTDVAWPLFLQRAGGFTLGYLATEGLEFETADRYGDEVAAAGGLEQWIARLDADPRRWAQRLDLARIEVEAMVAYLEENREQRTKNKNSGTDQG